MEIIELKLYTNCFMNMDFVTHRGSRRVTGRALCDDSAPLVAGHETERRAKLSDQHFRRSLHEMERKNSEPHRRMMRSRCVRSSPKNPSSFSFRENFLSRRRHSRELECCDLSGASTICRRRFFHIPHAA